MKLFKKHNDGKKLRSSSWLTGLAFIGIFGATAATTYFVLPQHVIIEKGGDSNLVPSDNVLTGRDRLIANMADSATKGMEITIDGLEFQFADSEGNIEGNVIKTPNAKDANGEYITDAQGGYANGERAFVQFAMNGLSIHDISMVANLPVEYNGKKRQVALGLFDEHAYVNLVNLDSTSDADKWDLKYKVSLEKTDIISGVETAIDPVTGGVPYYEYGDLDWLLDDMLSIISDGGIKGVDFGTLIDTIKDSIASPSSSEESEAGGIDLDGITDSLASMEEVRDHYFVWNLPLGETTLPLGFRAKGDNYDFAGVDFPAVLSETQDYFNFKEDEQGNPTMRIKASASITPLVVPAEQESVDFASFMPGDLSSYRDLRNSAALFESVATLFARPEASFDLSLDLMNHQDGVEGSRTVLAKDEVNDGMRIAVNGDFKSDMTANFSKKEELHQDFKFDFEGVSADVNLSQIQPNGGAEWEVVPNTTHRIQARYVKGSETEKGGEPFQDYDAYVNLNGLVEAKTSRLYLDELMGSLFAKEESVTADQTEQAEEANTVDQIAKFLPSLGNAIKSITDSDFVKGLGKGVYDSALDFVKTIEGGDSSLTVELTFAPIGLEGGATLSISNNQLIGIDFNDIKFMSFTLRGHLNLDLADIANIAMPENFAELKPLSHVYGLKDQIGAIVDAKSFEADIEGHVTSTQDGVLDADGQATTGLDINAKAAFDLSSEQGKGTVNAKLLQRSEGYYQQHNIAMDLYDELDSVALHYDSINDANVPHSTNPKNQNGIGAKLGLSTLLDLVKPSLNGITGIDDRFGRLINSLAKEESTSVLSDITSGNYFSLLSLQGTKYVNPIELGNESIEITLKGNELGLPEGSSFLIRAEFDESLTSTEEKGLSSLVIDIDYVDDKDVAHAIDFTVSGIKAKDENTELSSIENKESLNDISSIGELASYAVGTVSGVRFIEEEDPEDPTKTIETPVTGISYYGIDGDVSLNIAGYDIDVYGFDAYASVEGAETKAYARLHNLPVIRGVNGPDSSAYFRANEAEGVRDTDIYYYANGIDPHGEYLITRDSSYGKVRNVYDAMRFTGEQMNANPLGYLVQYGIGVLDDFFEESDEPAAEATSSSGSSKAIHFDDACLHYAYNGNSNAPVWDITMNLGELLGISPLGEVGVEISGEKVTQDDGHGNSASFKTLTSLEAGLKIGLVGHDSEGAVTNTMNVASAKVSLALNNIDGGVMKNVWLDAPEYAANFVGDVDDSGVIDESAKGVLYEAVRSSNASVNQTEAEAANYFIDWKTETLNVKVDEEIQQQQFVRQMMYYSLAYEGPVGCLYL